MNDVTRRDAPSPARRTARIILIVSAFMLPTLTLIPLGGLYLWEKGWILWWAVAAFVTVAVASLLQRSLLSQAASVVLDTTAASAEAPHENLTKLERLAWSDVRAIAASVDVGKLETADAIIDLGQRTVDAVARRLHPEKPDAVWRFTLPQALAITERVSARLGDFVDTRIPFGDRLTVAQLLSVYGWRRYIGVAEQAYDVWRVIRMANPATAVTQEARERLSRSLMNWGKEHVSRRIAEAFVEEVGRAAIDLYGGRLPTGVSGVAGEPAADPDDASADARPPSVLVVGAGASERDALAADLQALFADVAAAGAEGAAVAQPLVNVSDAIYPGGFARRQLTRAIAAADVVVWTVSAAKGPAEGDENAIAELRRFLVSAGTGVPPALIVGASGAPTDAALDLARYVGDLARGFGHPESSFEAQPGIIVPVAASGTARSADLMRLAEVAAQNVVHVRTARAAARRRASGRRGFWSSAGQAATAVGGLAGTILKPRNRERQP